MDSKKTVSTLIIITMLTLSACSIIGASQLDLDGSSWELTEINGSSPHASSTVTMKFADGQVSGNSTCNTYGGEYNTSRDGSIEFGMMMSTMMACMDPEGMEQETTYMQTIAEVETFQVNGSVLTFEDAEGVTLLIFEQVASE